MITIIGIPFGLQSLKLGMLAIWPFGTKVKWKPSQPHECAVVLCWRHLDLPHPYLLRPAALHHHHWHPLGKDALPAGKAGPVTIRNGSRISKFCYSMLILYRRRYFVKLS